MTFFLLLSLPFLIGKCSSSYINNFRFFTDNPLYVEGVPQSVVIKGTHYMDMYNSGNKLAVMAKWFETNVPEGISEVGKMLSNIRSPLVCTGDVAKLVSSISNGAALTNYVNNVDILYNVYVNSVQQLGATTKPDINNIRYAPLTMLVSQLDPAWSCSQLTLIPDNTLPFIGATRFEFTFNFTVFQPIIFMDFWGFGSFNLIQRAPIKSSQHIQGQALKLCRNAFLSTEMFMLEPKPVCPENIPEGLTVIGTGTLTVYKPNIVTVKRPAFRCSVMYARMHTYTNTFCLDKEHIQKKDFLKLTKEECDEMVVNKKFDFVNKVKSIYGRSNFGQVEGYDYSFDEGYEARAADYLVDISPSVLEPISTDGGGVNSDFMKWATIPNTSPRWADCNPGLGGSKAKSWIEASVTLGQVFVVMPTMKLYSDWQQFSPNALYDSYFEGQQQTIIWEPFTTADLCPYVPRVETAVKVIDMVTGTNQNDKIVNKEATAQRMFLADDIHAMFIVDDTQRVKNFSRFNCLTFEMGVEYYMTNKGELIKYVPSVADIIKGMGSSTRYASTEAYADISINKQGQITSATPLNSQMGDPDPVNSGNASLKLDTSNKTTSQNAIQQVNALQSSIYKSTSKNVTAELYGINAVAGSAQKPWSPRSIVKTTSQSDSTLNFTATGASIEQVYDYMQLQNLIAANRNLAIRAIQDCKRSALEWDIVSTLLQINPSAIISARTNQIVSAQPAGNGVFSVKPCELIVDVVRVLPLMFTNLTDYNVTVENVTYKWTDLLAAGGIVSDKYKCLSAPLILFKHTTSKLEELGQIRLDGSIIVDSFPLVEICDETRTHIFSVNGMTYFFKNYTLVDKMTTELFFNKTKLLDTIHQIGADLAKITIDAALANLSTPVRDIIASVYFIPIVSPLAEVAQTSNPISPYTYDQYTIGEMQSLPISILDMVERFAQNSLAQKVINGLVFSRTGFKSEGSMFDDFGNTVMGIVKFVGSAAVGLVKGTVSALGGFVEGAVSAISSPLMTILLVVAGVVGAVFLVVAGVTLMKRKKRRDHLEEEEEDEYSHYKKTDGDDVDVDDDDNNEQELMNEPKVEKKTPHHQQQHQQQQHHQQHQQQRPHHQRGKDSDGGNLLSTSNLKTLITVATPEGRIAKTLGVIK